MTTAERTRLAVIAEERLVRIVKVTYSIEELSAVTGDHPDVFRRRIHRGTLRARNTGRRYLITGPAAVAAGLWDAATLVDYRTVIDTDVEYTLHEVATLLDLSYYTVRRLLRAKRFQSVAEPMVRVKVRGAELLAYLGGADDPMQHPESA